MTLIFENKKSYQFFSLLNIGNLKYFANLFKL